MKIRNLICFNPRNSILRRIYIERIQDKINIRNRSKLKNLSPTLVCSNCTGGFLYHWLGLKFYSPFINLYLTPQDFVKALENWEEFISSEIEEEITNLGYPVGRVMTRGGMILIRFMHYDTFNEAITKWKNRKERMEKDPNKIGFMLTNWENDVSILERFSKLPFRNKIAFTPGISVNIPNTFNLKGLDKIKSPKQVYYTSHFSGKRFIDQFDYISFINGLKNSECPS